MFWPIIGAIAASLTTFSFIPQIIKVVRTKSAQDVSLVMLLQFSLGVTLWAVYGLYLKNAIIIAANVVSLASLLVLITLYFKYRGKSEGGVRCL